MQKYKNESPGEGGPPVNQVSFFIFNPSVCPLASKRGALLAYRTAHWGYEIYGSIMYPFNLLFRSFIDVQTFNDTKCGNVEEGDRELDME